MIATGDWGVRQHSSSLPGNPRSEAVTSTRSHGPRPSRAGRREISVWHRCIQASRCRARTSNSLSQRISPAFQVTLRREGQSTIMRRIETESKIVSVGPPSGLDTWSNWISWSVFEQGLASSESTIVRAHSMFPLNSTHCKPKSANTRFTQASSTKCSRPKLSRVSSGRARWRSSTKSRTAADSLWPALVGKAPQGV